MSVYYVRFSALRANQRNVYIALPASTYFIRYSLLHYIIRHLGDAETQVFVHTVAGDTSRYKGVLHES